MDPENTNETAAEETPDTTPAEGNDATGAEETEPTQAESDDTSGEVDKHGHPAISAGKYARDIKEKDEEIQRLQAELEEKSKTEEGRAELQKQIDELKTKNSDLELSYQLEKAGCRDDKAIKAAKSLLPEYENNISKLKEEMPYLFEQEKKKATGKKPDGSTNDSDSKLAEARKAAGIKKKE